MIVSIPVLTYSLVNPGIPLPTSEMKFKRSYSTFPDMSSNDFSLVSCPIRA